MTNSENNLEKICQMKNGDKLCADDLINEYEYLIFRVLGKIKGLKIDDDLIQEGRLGIYKALKQYEPGDLEAFIFKTIQNSIKDYIKKNIRQQKRFKEPTDQISLRPDKMNIEEDYNFKEKIQKLKDELTPDEFKIVGMLYAGYTHEEIGDSLEISKQAATKKIVNIRKKSCNVFQVEEEN